MTGDGSRTAAFEPRRLTIRRGAKVRFINESSVPHNVAFWPDSIPTGAAEALNQALPKRVGSLSSQFANRQGETIEVSFADTPTGMYKGYCVPHLALGMTIDILVQ
jgi:plastocyanin